MNKNGTITQQKLYKADNDPGSESTNEPQERVLRLAHILLQYAQENNIKIDTSLTESKTEGTLEE